MIEQELQPLVAQIAVLGDRVYPSGEAPQKPVTPYIVYFLVDDNEDFTHDGPTGLVTARFQFSIYADTALSAKTIAKELKTLLNDYKSASIQGAFYDSQSDQYEQATRLHHVPVDFMITYEE